MKRVMLTLAAVLSAFSVSAFGGDWPQWRGPERNGLATDSPGLVDAFGEGGAKKVWESEDLHAAGRGGWGSVVVADGRACVFADWAYDVPKDERVFEKGHLNGHGYAPEMPAELSAKVEEARKSEARKGLDWKTLDPWVNDWLKENVSEENKKFRGAAQTRLKAGENAVPLDVLAKLTTIVDKVFPDQAALDQWFRDNNIDEKTQKEAAKWVAKTRPVSKDFVICLDVQTGKVLWKTEVPSKGGATHNASGTPAVAGGRVYALTASSTVVCLDAKTGEMVWQKQPFEKPADVHSSVLVVDGLVVASGHGTVGLDAATGEVVWEAKGVRAANPSPGVWKNADRTCVIVHGGKLSCLDAKTGKVMWDLPGGGSASPSVKDDCLTCIVAKKLVAYRLLPDKAEKLWEVPFEDEYTSPIIYQDHVYAVGAAPRDGKQGRAVCVELKTGKVAWDAVVQGGAALSSPLVADGKIVAYAAGELVLMKASPDQYAELARQKVGGEGYTSPAVADGKLFCRVGSKVICYDLVK